jgi:hypothetical protein
MLNPSQKKFGSKSKNFPSECLIEKYSSMDPLTRDDKGCLA